MRQSRKRIVILGAGYAGIRVAAQLGRAKKRGAPIDIMLVSDRANHVDTPALYEVATAYLDRESRESSETLAAGVGVALRTIFSGQPITVVPRRLRDILPRERLVVCTDGTTYSFDVLVIGVGAAVAAHGIAGVREHAFGLKTISEALELRHHIVRQFMMATQFPADEQGRGLSFVVVGAGATGVELAAELCGQTKKLCARHRIDPTLPRIVLIESQTDVLPTLAPRLRQYARKRLEHRGVRLVLNQAVAQVQEHGVVLADGTFVPAATVVWTGGLSVQALLVGSQLPLAGWGVACENTLQVVDHPTIFAAGDAAVLVHYPEEIPGVVPVAYTQGRTVATNILHQLAGEPLDHYQYRTLGAMVAVGGKAAVLQLSGAQRGMAGHVPWVLKKLVALRYWLSVLPPGRAFSLWRQGLKLHSMND